MGVLNPICDYAAPETTKVIGDVPSHRGTTFQRRQTDRFNNDPRGRICTGVCDPCPAPCVGPPRGGGDCGDCVRTRVSAGAGGTGRLAANALTTLAENAESELGEIMGCSMRRIG